MAAQDANARHHIAALRAIVNAAALAAEEDSAALLRQRYRYHLGELARLVRVRAPRRSRALLHRPRAGAATQR